jgi:hypothetical protein
MTAKKAKTDDLDNDLADLYKSASEAEICCPACAHKFKHGGDFTEKARAMELRIKYQALKNRGGKPVASFFDEED